MEGSLDEERQTDKEPLLKNSLSKGGVRTMPFIIANGMLEKIASFGVTPNMTLYLMGQYHMEMTAASTLLFYWSAASSFMPVIGAILADSYVGRFYMIGFGSVLSFLGMTLLWLISMIPQVKPPPCDDQFSSYCKSTTAPQLLLLCSSFALISLGGGGIRSSSLAFGADQLEMELSAKPSGTLERYFGWYYASYTLGVLIALTCIVYIQDTLGWAYGFGVCALLMVCATIVFFLAAPFYVKIKVRASLVIELCQVIVASCKKWHLRSSSGDIIMYHHRRGSMLAFPTDSLRFLNKACIIIDPQRDLNPDGEAADSWSLCTVDQVEDLKALLKVIPIWSTGMLTFINACQGSFSVLQASSLNRKIIAGFEIPAGSFGIFVVAFVILWVPFYDRVILPIASRIKGEPINLSPKVRMGLGIFVSYLSVVVTAIVEGIRRDLAIEEGLSDDPETPVNMSALWIVPQFCLLGLAEGLNAIAQNEFYISELPKSMSSIATNLGGVGMSLAGILASFMMNIIDKATKGGGNESWVSSNINKGHYDYYFWVLSGLSMLNLMYFVICSWAYGSCKSEEVKPRDEEVVY